MSTKISFGSLRAELLLQRLTAASTTRFSLGSSLYFLGARPLARKSAPIGSEPRTLLPEPGCSLLGTRFFYQEYMSLLPGCQPPNQKASQPTTASQPNNDQPAYQATNQSASCSTNQLADQQFKEPADKRPRRTKQLPNDLSNRLTSPGMRRCLFLGTRFLYP